MAATNYIKIAADVEGPKSWYFVFFDDGDDASVKTARTAAHSALRRGKTVAVYRPTVHLQPDADVRAVVGVHPDDMRAMQLCARLRARGSITADDLKRFEVRRGHPPDGTDRPLAWLGGWVSNGLLARRGDGYVAGPRFADNAPDGCNIFVRDALAEIERAGLQ